MQLQQQPLPLPAPDADTAIRPGAGEHPVGLPARVPGDWDELDPPNGHVLKLVDNGPFHREGWGLRRPRACGHCSDLPLPDGSVVTAGDYPFAVEGHVHGPDPVIVAVHLVGEGLAARPAQVPDDDRRVSARCDDKGPVVGNAQNGGRVVLLAADGGAEVLGGAHAERLPRCASPDDWPRSQGAGLAASDDDVVVRAPAGGKEAAVVGLLLVEPLPKVQVHQAAQGWACLLVLFMVS
mmetsp:Transcript_30456/g.54706  ORF Transcript_30456/g.54706 Transcript_30456/m.54706 type:complete len:237 (-) Transcript_30456:520-1230(-)